MRLTRVVAVVLGAVALQLALARYAVGGRFVFDFVLVGVVYVALHAGPVAGMLGGTIGGLLQDVASGGIVGLGGLVDTILGYAAGVLGTRLVVARAYGRASIVAAATLARGLMASGLHAVIDQSWPAVAWAGLLEEAAINTLVGWIAFQLTESLPGAVARSRSRQRTSWGRRQW
jgi:rod shape-determining protein MreD